MLWHLVPFDCFLNKWKLLLLITVALETFFLLWIIHSSHKNTDNLSHWLIIAVSFGDASTSTCTPAYFPSGRCRDSPNQAIIKRPPSRCDLSCKQTFHSSHLEPTLNGNYGSAKHAKTSVRWGFAMLWEWKAVRGRYDESFWQSL